MNAYDIIDRLPYEMAARLQSDPFFADIPVVVMEAGNVNLEMKRRAALTEEKSGKRGAAVVVLQLVADDMNPHLQLGPMKYYPAFQVLENVELNNDDAGTKKSHRKIARRIRDLFKTTGFVGLVEDLRPAKPCIEPVDMSEIGELIRASQVNFECLEIPLQSITVVQPPVCTVVNNTQIELTCPTAGAEIWFTLDESFPYPGDKTVYDGSTSQRYAAPINITPPGITLRACGYLPGSEDSIPSWIIRKSIVTEPV
jgi:hypothetical protein